jgi:hypothetical protein
VRQRIKSAYLENKKVQIGIGIVCLLGFILSLVGWFSIDLLAVQIALFPFAVSVSQFSLTPIFRASGSYKYYSDFLLVYNPNQTTYDLHLGSSFDYALHMKWSDRGIVARKKLLAGMLTGLMRIIDDGEKGILPGTLVITGTSYFFSDSSVKRFGFQLTEPTAAYRTNLILNFVDLYWMSVFTSGSWRFPKLNKAKKAEITLEALIAQKSKIEQLNQKLLFTT